MDKYHNYIMSVGFFKVMRLNRLEGLIINVLIWSIGATHASVFWLLGSKFFGSLESLK